MKQKLKRKPQEHKNHIYFFDTLNHSSIKSLKAMLCINVHTYIYLWEWEYSIEAIISGSYVKLISNIYPCRIDLQPGPIPLRHRKMHSAKMGLRSGKRLCRWKRRIDSPVP